MLPIELGWPCRRGDRMTRRKFTALLAGAALVRSTLTYSQPAQKVPIVGFLHPGFPDSRSPAFEALSQGLREAGYIQGETVKIEARWAHGKPDALAPLVQEVIHLGSPLIRQAGTRTAEILSTRRIPGISQFRTFPEGGGLMSYGPDLIHLYRRVGPIVGKILRGARPADLPIERPTKFELVIN